jgi:hypothetical protein
MRGVIHRNLKTIPGERRTGGVAHCHSAGHTAPASQLARNTAWCNEFGLPCRVGRLLPRVNYGYAGRLEIAHIPGDNRHAMHKRSGCDEGISIGAGIRHME